MSQTNKILLGIATLLPVIGIIVALSYFFSMFMNPELLESSVRNPRNPLEAMPDGFFNYLVAIVLTAIVSLALTVIYIVHIVRNRAVAESNRVVWILLVVLAGTIGQAIYFFLYVVPNKPPVRP